MVTILSQNGAGVVGHLATALALLLMVDLLQGVRRVDAATFLYQVLLATGTLPWLMHYRWVAQTRGGWGPAPTGVEDPGLAVFLVLSPFLVYGMLAIAGAVAAWSFKGMCLAAGLPAIVFLATFFLELPLLRRGAPGEPYLADNLSQVWFFLHSAAATLLLLGCLAGLRRLRPEMA